MPRINLLLERPQLAFRHRSNSSTSMNKTLSDTKNVALKITRRSVLKAMIAAKLGLSSFRPASSRAEAPDRSPVPGERPSDVFEADVFQADVFE